MQDDGDDEAISLYAWTTPNGYKISIMLEELGVPYKVHLIDIGKGEQFAPEFLKISPNNRIPAIVDPDGPDGQPISIFESGAILQYLGRKFDCFYPTNERRKSDVEQWLFWQVGGLGPMSGQCSHFTKYAPEKIPYAMDRYTQEVTRLFGVMERNLADKDFLAGEYSIADIASFPWVRQWKGLGQEITQFPRLSAWMTTIAARPAVQRGLDVGKTLG
jgi:GST-like protein